VASASEDRRWRLLVRALGVSALIGAVLVAAYVVGASTIVRLVLPDTYARAADVLPLLAAGLAGMGIYSVLSQWWMGIGRPGPPAATLTLGAAVAIGLQCALTPAHGGRGAATAIVCGVGCALVVLGAATVRRQRSAGRRAAATPA
jgi:O-antigen/teichoic acid export membrane protein